MTATYDRMGMQFRYPENWKLTDDTTDEVPRTISLQAPSGAFWSVDIHPFSVDPEELLERTLQIMRTEYEGLEAHSWHETIQDQDVLGYEMYFHCLDFVVASRVLSLRHGHASYVLTYQAEDRDFDDLEDVFRAITLSLFMDV